jgi:hypothetical protein
MLAFPKMVADFSRGCAGKKIGHLLFVTYSPPHHSRIARDSIVLLEAVSYTRSARTIRRFWKVG